MSEKQLRLTNVLLFLILIVLLLNLAVNLIPYYITGAILRLFSSSNKSSPAITISTSIPEANQGPIYFAPTITPWTFIVP
jgi:hypothetical protein